MAARRLNGGRRLCYEISPMRKMRKVARQLVLSTTFYGLAGVIAYFCMFLIPGFTNTQRELVIPVFLLVGVIMAIYQIIERPPP